MATITPNKAFSVSLLHQIWCLQGVLVGAFPVQIWVLAFPKRLKGTRKHRIWCFFVALACFHGVNRFFRPVCEWYVSPGKRRSEQAPMDSHTAEQTYAPLWRTRTENPEHSPEGPSRTSTGALRGSPRPLPEGVGSCTRRVHSLSVGSRISLLIAPDLEKGVLAPEKSGGIF